MNNNSEDVQKEAIANTNSYTPRRRGASNIVSAKLDGF